MDADTGGACCKWTGRGGSSLDVNEVVSMALTLTLACSGMMGKSRWKRLGKPQLWITFDLLDSICSVAFSTRQDSVLLMVLYLIFTAPIGATKISHIFLRKKGDL
jgi:hypothetical protein